MRTNAIVNPGRRSTTGTIVPGSAIVGALTLALVLASAACRNPKVRDTSGTQAGGSSGTTGAGAPGSPPTFVLPPAPAGGAVAQPGTGPCLNLQCQQTTCRLGSCKQTACSGGQKTTLRGRVFDPAGRVPLYNVLVYVPNAPLDPIASGPSCDRCDTPISGKPVTSSLTDTKGDFVLDNVPVGTDIPLVVQVGKWRRELRVPRTLACTENVIDDPQLVRLPRNRTEGNIPKIALTTGGADVMECLLRKIGVEDSEFTPESGPGRINLFAGFPEAAATRRYAPNLNGGVAFTPARQFWENPTSFDSYDMVVLSCEGSSFPNEKNATARTALVAYADKGGRVFASHWHNIWLMGGPAPWPEVATFRLMGPANLPDGFVGEVDTTFPKGAALSDWLVNVGASTSLGQLPIREGRTTVAAVNPIYSTQWIRSPLGQPPGVQYFTFNSPVAAPADRQCGRVVFTDIHVSADDDFGPAFPGGCTTTTLSPQEKALEFVLFDLSSCVQPDTQAPVIP